MATAAASNTASPRPMEAWPESMTSMGHSADVMDAPWSAELKVPLSLDETWIDTMPAASRPSSSYACWKRPGDAWDVLGSSEAADSIP